MRMLLRVLAGLVLLVVVAAGVVYAMSQSKLGRSFEIEAAEVEIPDDAEALVRGRHQATIRGCTGCHGENLAGETVIEDPAMGTIHAPNLTIGEGGLPPTYSNADWVTAIRHGVGADGRPLQLMPSSEYWPMDNGDLGDLIAYLKALPPVDAESPASRPGPLARVLLSTGALPMHVDLIDHEAEIPDAPEPAVTAEYGAYLALTCTGCHGHNLSGGKITGAPPDWPEAANLTPHETGLEGWEEADFFTALREAERPDGTKLDPIMPAEQFGKMTNDELSALWMYLESLPATPHGERDV